MIAGFGALDALLDLAHRVQIFVELRLVAAADARRQTPSFLAHRVEDAARLLDSRESLGAAAAVTEQPLEHEPRMVLGQVRRRLVAPRDGVHVETVARVASALRRGIDRELERAYRRRPTEHVRRELIRARSELHLDAGPRSIPRVD